MVLAQHVEKLLRRRRLDESSEAAEIAEDARDVGAMSSEELLAVFAGDELRDLRRDESRQLGALPLDRVEQARVRDRDRRLVGEGLHERDVLVAETLWRLAHHQRHPDQLVLDDHGHAEHRPVQSRAGVRVLRILLDVGDVHRFPCDGRAAGGRRPVERMRMLGVVLDGFGEAVVRSRVEKPVLEEVERTLVGLRQPLAGLDHLVENRLQAA